MICLFACWAYGRKRWSLWPLRGRGFRDITCFLFSLPQPFRHSSRGRASTFDRKSTQNSPLKIFGTTEVHPSTIAKSFKASFEEVDGSDRKSTSLNSIHV